jgi:hypothetical protein
MAARLGPPSKGEEDAENRAAERESADDRRLRKKIGAL